MALFNRTIEGDADGQAASLGEASADPMRATSKRSSSTTGSSPSPVAPVAFASLIDLLRSRGRTAQSSDVCEDCKTLNRRGALYCKTCMHKLPAYYTSVDPHTPFVIWRNRMRAESRKGAWDLVAAWIVLISLVLMTAYIPVD